MITKEKVAQAVAAALTRAAVEIPADVQQGLREALEQETDALARLQIRTILDNIALAHRKGVAVCQDTGLPLFFIELGSQLCLDFDLTEAVAEGLVRATEEAPLRPNVVHPLTRSNLGNNLGPRFPLPHITLIPGSDHLAITVVPKGAGSENRSAFEMTPVLEGVKGVRSWVLRKIAEFMGMPCPPYIVGVGVGGSADIAMLLAKEGAVLRKVGSHNPDPVVAALEEELKSAINSLGIGAMGLGGNITALAVNIEVAGTHTGLVPVAVNIQCWADRRETVRIAADGSWQMVEGGA